MVLCKHTPSGRVFSESEYKEWRNERLQQIWNQNHRNCRLTHKNFHEFLKEASLPADDQFHFQIENEEDFVPIVLNGTFLKVREVWFDTEHPDCFITFWSHQIERYDANDVIIVVKEFIDEAEYSK